MSDTTRTVQRQWMPGQKTVKTTLRWLGYVILLVVFVMPFWGAIATSFTSADLNPGQIVAWPSGGFTLDNYSGLWVRLRFFRFFYNSVYVTAFAVVGQIVVSTLAAFALGRMKFKGHGFITMAFITTLMLTETLLMIPLYLLLLDLPLIGVNLIGTRAGMILPVIAWAFPIIILTEFIRDIPQAIEDSARIDGARDFTVYTRIMLPLIKPALGTCLIFGFVMAWNQFLLPLIVSPDQSLHTLPVALSQITQAFEPSDNFVPLWMAGAVITMIPSVIVYGLLQRFFIEGLSRGAIKG